MIFFTRLKVFNFFQNYFYKEIKNVYKHLLNNTNIYIYEKRHLSSINGVYRRYLKKPIGVSFFTFNANIFDINFYFSKIKKREKTS